MHFRGGTKGSPPAPPGAPCPPRRALAGTRIISPCSSPLLGVFYFHSVIVSDIAIRKRYTFLCQVLKGKARELSSSGFSNPLTLLFPRFKTLHFVVLGNCDCSCTASRATQRTRSLCYPKGQDQDLFFCVCSSHFPSRQSSGQGQKNCPRRRLATTAFGFWLAQSQRHVIQPTPRQRCHTLGLDCPIQQQPCLITNLTPVTVPAHLFLCPWGEPILRPLISQHLTSTHIISFNKDLCFCRS